MCNINFEVMRMERWVDKDEYYYVEYEMILEYYNDGVYNRFGMCMTNMIEIVEDVELENYFEDIMECEWNRYEYFVNGYVDSGDCGVEWKVIRNDGSGRMGIRWY